MYIYNIQGYLRENKENLKCSVIYLNIINYIQNDDDLQSLERLFTEEGENITITVYRTKMKQWIYSIRKRK